MTLKKKRRTQKRPNFLPEHIGKAMEKDLDRLISELANSPCPKARYLKSEYKSKYLDDDVVSPDTRRAAALAKWLAAEERNQRTNQRLLLDEVDFGWCSSELLFERARKIIADVLGDINLFTLNGGSHSNGASTRVGRSPKGAVLKHSGQAHISSSAVKHWVLDSAKGSRIQSQELAIQESSVFFTVPKATDIDRVACKEPEVNMFMQREVGRYFRGRLKRVGIDLRDQTRNQKLAAEALKLGLATIDLSSASDTITITLVNKLLPTEWFLLLDDLRVKSTIIDGELHHLSMFSSMGNGFTFELETLIFYALVRAICWGSGVKGIVSVYGDDIICSSKIGPRLARVFAWLGFKVNSKKSNWSGPLRESCGKHYHNSWEVTPFYLRAPIRRKTDVIRILNRLTQWSGEGWGVILHAPIILFHRRWARIIPTDLYGGTDLESDAALVTGDKPRKRLIPRSESLSLEGLDEARLTWWLTTRRSVPHDEALCCDPAKVRGFIVSHQPAWQGPSEIVSPYYLESYLLSPNLYGPTSI